nr:hypothetical protein Itr_chr03CG01870 [Ipomoea trifida]
MNLTLADVVVSAACLLHRCLLPPSQPSSPPIPSSYARLRDAAEWRLLHGSVGSTVVGIESEGGRDREHNGIFGRGQRWPTWCRGGVASSLSCMQWDWSKVAVA